MSDNVNNQYDFFKSVNLDNNGNLGVNVVGGGDNYYTTGGTYNSGTEELEFVGNDPTTTFNVDVSALAGGGGGGDAISSLGDVEYTIHSGWNSPIKIAPPITSNSYQITEKSIHIFPLVVKDGQKLNDFMFQVTNAGTDRPLDLAVYNSEYYTFTSGLNTLTSIRPKDLLGSVTGIDVTTTGVKIITDIDITFTTGVSNVYYIMVGNFAEVLGTNPSLSAMASNAFGGQNLIESGKWVTTNPIPTNLLTDLRTPDWMYVFSFDPSIISFPVSDFTSVFGLPEGGKPLATTSDSRAIRPFFFWR
jgi:hypothetical protein